jgi:N-acetylneuraminic acid mutarotase
LLCEHQMCVDPVGRKLYVFGGRILTADSTPTSYSGLYTYDMDTNVWDVLR